MGVHEQREIRIESKDEIKKRIKRSPDRGDCLANTFWPVEIMIIRGRCQTEMY
jgi:hypothetical protein